jgi:hypothetical protein
VTRPANELLQVCKGRGFATADVKMFERVFEQIVSDAYVAAEPIDRTALASLVLSAFLEFKTRAGENLLDHVRARRDQFLAQ